jgi:hypothetical protein
MPEKENNDCANCYRLEYRKGQANEKGVLEPILVLIQCPYNQYLEGTLQAERPPVQTQELEYR